MPADAPAASTDQPANNNISLSLPTDFLTGSGGGLNLNFNLGGNGTTIANSAYNFLNGSFATADQFLGNSIAGTQNYIGTLAAPGLLTAASLNATFNNLMPNIIGNLFGAATQANTVSEQISANSTAASEAASQASIAESQKASKGGKCFITTAVCETLDLEDDNAILNKLRHFRDTYMMLSPQRKSLVHHYYCVAPGYVAKIKRRKDSAAIFSRIYRLFIIPAIEAINSGDHDEAFAIYSAMVEYTYWKAAHES